MFRLLWLNFSHLPSGSTPRDLGRAAQTCCSRLQPESESLALRTAGTLPGSSMQGLDEASSVELFTLKPRLHNLKLGLEIKSSDLRKEGKKLLPSKITIYLQVSNFQGCSEFRPQGCYCSSIQIFLEPKRLDPKKAGVGDTLVVSLGGGRNPQAFLYRQLRAGFTWNIFGPVQIKYQLESSGRLLFLGRQQQW